MKKVHVKETGTLTYAAVPLAPALFILTTQP